MQQFVSAGLWLKVEQEPQQCCGDQFLETSYCLSLAVVCSFVEVITLFKSLATHCKSFLDFIILESSLNKPTRRTLTSSLTTDEHIPSARFDACNIYLWNHYFCGLGLISVGLNKAVGILTLFAEESDSCISSDVLLRKHNENENLRKLNKMFGNRLYHPHWVHGFSGSQLHHYDG